MLGKLSPFLFILLSYSLLALRWSQIHALYRAPSPPPLTPLISQATSLSSLLLLPLTPPSSTIAPLPPWSPYHWATSPLAPPLPLPPSIVGGLSITTLSDASTSSSLYTRSPPYRSTTNCLLIILLNKGLWVVC